MAFLASIAPLALWRHPHNVGRQIAFDLVGTAATACRAGVPSTPIFLARRISEWPLTPADEVAAIARARRFLPWAVARQNIGCVNAGTSFLRASFVLLGPYDGLVVLRVSRNRQ